MVTGGHRTQPAACAPENGAAGSQGRCWFSCSRSEVSVPLYALNNNASVLGFCVFKHSAVLRGRMKALKGTTAAKDP